MTTAIVLWNTVYRDRATQAMRETGIKAFDDAFLQSLSSLGWEHTNLTDDYVWRQNCKVEDRKFNRHNAEKY